MEDPYKKLAQRLDQIPNGFPRTESGVELRLLAKLFTPEEAALAAELTLQPDETAEELALRLHRDRHQLRQMLKEMLKKGLIDAEPGKGGFAYKLLPFVVGIYEHQNAQIDEEFARLFEEYYHQAFHRVMTARPSVHRVIPVERAIPWQVEVLPYERASHYIEQARAWGVLNCICRVQKRLIGQGCRHSVENCLVLSPRPGAFDHATAIRALSKEEALAVLAAAEQEGFVHSTSNVQEGVSYICNCCICSCGVLRGIAELGALGAVAPSSYQASVDSTLCSACGTCIERCQFSALSLDGDSCTVEVHRCVGCGLCVSTCPTGAIRLELRATAEHQPPPRTEEEWRSARSAARKESAP
ncbi:MAG: 4Fe-4S binding protein [bacterium]|jgi:ferredoxin/predicted transcriptional regulator|nr:4Fe-4S binding protein [candidate division KSB1 bacterium]MDH7560841.1 4Fe-4S binding protein [bacterium]